VAPLPPELGEAEGELDQPEEREANHGEEHPRADPPGGRLAHEPVAVARVYGQDDEHCELGKQEVPAHEAPVIPGPLELGRAEEAIDIHGREAQAGRDPRPPEEKRCRRPHAREREEDQAGSEAANGHENGQVKSCATGSSLPVTGPLYG
jgi:hypothetical protein